MINPILKDVKRGVLTSEVCLDEEMNVIVVAEAVRVVARKNLRLD